MARRSRSEATFRRREGRKKGAPRILIVCEGEKTETNYFNAIRRERRISSARVRIMPSDFGTDPLNVVNYALDQFLKEDKAFDLVYAVFDRDDHLNFNNALSRAAALDESHKNDAGVPVPFKAIPSVPNFELWLLLHFRDVLAPIHRATVYAELRKPGIYPAYAKNIASAYDDTKARIAAATQRAVHLRGLFTPPNGTDPYTDVDVLAATILAIPSAWA
ncbi:CRISPR-associated protein [Mesorhizobium sp. LSHC420B00]|uniref:RloB family protein n=1 Tax=unclassified Mesorhizobium TaxID=325217 RepID=UPI0003CEFA6E|nr:RloB family protein [Mesorhizobium sp. LSHC420B00]ESX66038.1 CRISPR-associated protein [Mesorhizobium sp. LSHC420B00]